ncbi:MAG: hypothetical protein HC904_05380 [Blastochloris sp.]|nr:hypothetical protein [Blastochloris sp.]
MIIIFSVAAGAALFYGLYRLGLWIYETKYLSPSERWKRRYDRKLKSYFKQMGG